MSYSDYFENWNVLKAKSWRQVRAPMYSTADSRNVIPMLLKAIEESGLRDFQSLITRAETNWKFLHRALDMANTVYDQGVKALSKTETERKLAEALSHANWGASATMMGELAQATADPNEFQVIMRETWAAIASTGRNWRVAYKGLALLEYLLKNGHKRVLQEAKENRTKIRRMETFSYVSNGVEKGAGVREKAKAVTELLDDEEVLKRERAEAAKLRAKFVGVGRDGQFNSSISGYSGSGGYDDFDEDRKASDASDDEDDKKKKKKSSSKKKKGSSDEEEADSDEDKKPKSKSKSKKKQASDDEFEPDFDASPVKKSSSAASKKKAAAEESNDEDDFGFSDDDSKKKKSSGTSAIKLGPLSSISVKIPGAGGSSSGTTTATSSATTASAKKKEDKEVNLLGDFDPFGTPAPVAASTAAAPAPAKSQASNILDLFGSSAPTPVAPQSVPTMGGYPAMQPQGQAFGYPAMGGGFPGTPMAPQQQQPMMMGMAAQQQAPMMMMPQMGMGMPPPQQPMMMMGGMPPMGMGMPPQPQQPMMMMPQMGMQGMGTMGSRPVQQQMPMKPAAGADAQKKDAFSGLMDLYPAATGGSAPRPPTGSLI